MERVDDVDIRIGGISLRQQLRVKLSRNVEQSLGGKNDQVQISQLINRESHIFEATVESAVFVIKCPQPIESLSWLAFSSIASSFYDLKLLIQCSQLYCRLVQLATSSGVVCYRVMTHQSPALQGQGEGSGGLMEGRPRMCQAFNHSQRKGDFIERLILFFSN